MCARQCDACFRKTRFSASAGHKRIACGGDAARDRDVECLRRGQTFFGDGYEFLRRQRVIVGGLNIAREVETAQDPVKFGAVKLAVGKAPNNVVTRASARLTRTNNVLSTGELLCTISLVPRANINAITTTITYTLTAAGDA